MRIKKNKKLIDIKTYVKIKLENIELKFFGRINFRKATTY